MPLSELRTFCQRLNSLVAREGEAASVDD